jgi:hypothetical protein
MEKLRIGLTIGLKSADESIWTNGMKLNILYLARLLKNSTMGYEVVILNTTDIDLSGKGRHFEGFELVNLKDRYKDIDLLISIGSQVEKKYLQYFHEHPDKKVVAYKCGNNYVLSIEEVLFKESKTFFEIETELDEIWYVPQQHDTNVGYYSTVYRAPAVVVPFLWDHQNMLDSIKEIDQNHKDGKFKRGHNYDPTKQKKTIGVLEPNLNVVKYCLIPAMIAEESYRTPVGREKIDSLMLTNALDVSKHKTFLSLIRTFDLYKDGKITAESRYQTAYIVSQYLDIIVSHQMLNPLNYLYLDAAFMGYPVLHNAPMCKDLGYYYEGSDTVAAAEKLNWILENHDSNMKEYTARNTGVLWRYSVRNMALVKVYDDLIFNLFNGGNKRMEYVPETNLYSVSDIRNKVDVQKTRIVPEVSAEVSEPVKEVKKVRKASVPKKESSAKKEKKDTKPRSVKKKK